MADFQTDSTRRFKADVKANEVLANTLKLSNAKESDFDAVMYPGGHGLLWDLVESKTSQNLIESFYANKKPISFVCHAPAILKNIQDNKGDALVKGKNVTGFTNGEEKAVQLTDVVPFLIEDMMKEKGANYSKTGDWQPYALEDGLLITGQNPASSSKVADLLMKKLK